MATTVPFPPFINFPSLPLELRLQIWRETLPETDDAALYFYRRRCWAPGEMSESDPRFVPDDGNLTLGLRHELLDHIQYDLPQAFVNREARNVALDWARETGVQTKISSHSKGLVFVRRFDPTRDILYMMNWKDFCSDPIDRQSEPDLIEKMVDTDYAMIRIAISEEVFDYHTDALPELFDWFELSKLFVIINHLDNSSNQEDGSEMQQNWGVEKSERRTLTWDRGRCSFALGPKNGIDSDDADDETAGHIVKLNETIGARLVQGNVSSFQIRFLVAVQRR